MSETAYTAEGIEALAREIVAGAEREGLKLERGTWLTPGDAGPPACGCALGGLAVARLGLDIAMEDRWAVRAPVLAKRLHMDPDFVRGLEFGFEDLRPLREASPAFHAGYAAGRLVADLAGLDPEDA